jgi:uncharacterized protein DUF4349
VNPSDFTHDDLVAALRAERPAPRPEFASALDARLAAGFHREGSLGELRRLLERLPSGRPVPTAVSGGAEVGNAPAASPPPAAPPVAEESRRSAGAMQAATPAASTRERAAVPRALRDTLSSRRARAVERSAQMTLATQPSKVENVADGVIGVVDRHHGIVSSSSVTGGDAIGAGAQFQLLIPGDQLQATLADLSNLAHVRSRTQGTLDITRPVVTAGSRLRVAQKRRDALLRQLAAASTPAETASLHYRIRIVESEIASARRQLRALHGRVSYSRVDLSIVGDESAAGSWGLRDAVKDAGRVLTVIAGSALVGLAVLVPLGLVTTVAWLGYAAIRRRGRERALDGR